jgi:SAM-dependent methyltransferase
VTENDATEIYALGRDSQWRRGPGSPGLETVTEVYALGRDSEETARLVRQADELAPEAERLLDYVGLKPGQSAIDLGCGPRGILALLRDRVSPGGRVVGLDADPAHTALAAQFAGDWAEIITADARKTGLASGSFDVVHARTLLINVPDPQEVVAEMTRLTRPGGWVAVHDVDAETAICYPPHPAFDQIQTVFRAVHTRNGADWRLGRRLPGLLRQAGLTEIGTEVVAQLYRPGSSRRTLLADLVHSMWPRALELGLASAAELAEADAQIRAHFADPDTLVISGLNFLVWGRRPVF